MREQPSFDALLVEALREPGIMDEAYRAFHEFSFGNALAAISQCRARKLPVGPIATYNRWRGLGRHVRAGEQAIVLCMPLTRKRAPAPNAPADAEPQTFVQFVWKPLWFVLAQTDGQGEYPAFTVGEWSEERALAALAITRATFEHFNGNVKGYARERTVTVSPIAPHPFRTLIHEIAHVVLGHTTGGRTLEDGEVLTRASVEVEAEGAAYICASILGDTEGSAASRAYLQHWRAQGDIPEAKVLEKHAARMFKAADAILKAGRERARDAQAAQ